MRQQSDTVGHCVHAFSLARSLPDRGERQPTLRNPQIQDETGTSVDQPGAVTTEMKKKRNKL
jgi:hypothetical protein